MRDNDTLFGQNEAEARLRRMVDDKNNGKIDYPRGTNERGYPNVRSAMRESHAHGDSVGGVASAPGRGGSHMKPHFGKPQHGREEGHLRRNAVKQARAENHAHGDMVGGEPEHHAFGAGVGRAISRMGNTAGRNIRSGAQAAGQGIRQAANAAGRGIQAGANRIAGAMPFAEGENVSQEDMSMNRAMGGYRSGGRPRHHSYKG